MQIPLKWRSAWLPSAWLPSAWLPSAWLPSASLRWWRSCSDSAAPRTRSTTSALIGLPITVIASFLAAFWFGRRASATQSAAE